MPQTKKQQAREVLDSLEGVAGSVNKLARSNSLDVLPVQNIQALRQAANRLLLQVHEAQGALTVFVLDEETDDDTE